MRLDRSDTSLLARWWFTVDRTLIVAVLALVGAGLWFSLTATPAIAVKRGLTPFYFFSRQALFALAGAAIVLWLSFLSPRQIRRVALLVLFAALAAMVAVLLVGPEINGARRWLRIAGHSVQPSELVKPALIVISAWLLAESERREDVPARPIAIALYLSTVALLLLQPDVGQTLLLTAVWGGMFFVSGLSRRAAIGMLGMILVGAAGAYFAFSHVRDRVGKFISPAAGENYQVERALQAVRQGGLFGRGPGEGTVKTIIPDAHTDFMFAVIAEEYGIVTCLVLVGLVAFLLLRALARALSAEDPFRRNAIAGLALIFALQAAINMAVNVGILPAKGMTLPFISYGGSSILGLSLAMGFLIALARREPAAR